MLDELKLSNLKLVNTSNLITLNALYENRMRDGDKK